MSDETLELTIEESTSTTEEEITGDVWELTIETGARGFGSSLVTVEDWTPILVDANTGDVVPNTSAWGRWNISGGWCQWEAWVVFANDVANVTQMFIVLPAEVKQDTGKLRNCGSGWGILGTPNSPGEAAAISTTGGDLSGAFGASVPFNWAIFDHVHSDQSPQSFGTRSPLDFTSDPDGGYLKFFGAYEVEDWEGWQAGSVSGPQGIPGTSGTGGAVDSVNGDTGVVVLTQDDVGDGTTFKQYSATEETKLAGVATGATANSSDATLLDRANHTGTQAHTTITGLGTLATLSAIPNNGVRKILCDGYLWDAVSGSQVWNVDTATAQGGGFISGEAVNDYTEWTEWMDAGTWTLEVWHIAGSSSGIFTITLDGGSAIGATVDGYAASTTRNNRVTRTGISVGTSGLHTLRIAVLSKNGSSSGYRSGIQAFAWRRTA